MTREQLEAVHDALTCLIGAWNRAAADEDRGPSNDGLVLTLYDDGSGRLGRRRFGPEVEDWHDFNNLDELVDVLARREGVEFDCDPTREG